MLLKMFDVAVLTQRVEFDLDQVPRKLPQMCFFWFLTDVRCRRRPPF